MVCTSRVRASFARRNTCRHAVTRFAARAFAWVAFLGFPVLAFCANIDLRWDPVDDVRVTGYEVHYGLDSGQYQWSVEANRNQGETNTKTVENLQAGNTYHFAVRSCNHDTSLVSTFSNEVSVTVESESNQAPVMTDPGGQSGTVGDAVSLGMVASDPDEDTLTYTASGLPTGLGIDTQSGLISGTLGGAGTYSVTVAVSDGSDQASASFNWVVAAANSAPTLTNPGGQSGTVGDAVSFGMVASDPDEDTLTYTASGLPTGLGIDTQSGLISGTLGGAGTYSVTVTVSDGFQQASASFNWVVFSSNHESLFQEDFASGSLNGWTVVDEGDQQGPSAWSATTGRMVQDSNIWGESGGERTLPKPGTYAVYDGGYPWTDYRVTLAVSSGDNDEFGLMFRVQDSDNYYRFSWNESRGYRQLVKNVGGVFTLLDEDAVPYVQGQTYQLDVSVQSDQIEVRIDGNLVFSVTDASISQGSIAAYSWANHPVVFDDISITGVLTSNQAPVISAVTAAPSVLNDTATSQLQVSASDADGPQALTYSWMVPDDAGSLSDVTSATPTYTPPDVTGSQDVRLAVQVSDGEATVTGQVTITVNDVPNQAPEISAVTAAPSVLNETATSQLQVSASDADGPQALTYSWMVPNDAGSLSDITSATPTYTPPDVTGSQDVRLAVQVSDGEATVTGQVTITVNDVPNQAPEISAVTAAPSVLNETATSQLQVSASDADGPQALTYSWMVPDDAGSLSDVTSATPTYTPPDVTGSQDVRLAVQVSDGEATVTGQVTITVNDVPTIRAEAGVALGVTNAEWTLVTLEHTYDSMVVVATPRYSPSAPPQIVRVHKTDAHGNSFELGIARADGSTDLVSTTVDYLVVEEGIYDAATHGVTMEAVKYASAVTDSKSSWAGEWQTYANTYSNPVVIGQVMSANDPLPSSFWARGSSRTDPPDASMLYTGKTVSEDPELVRVDETIGYIVIEAGNGTLGGRYFEAGVGADSVRGMGNAAPYEYSLGNLVSAEVALLSMTGLDGADGGWPVLAQDLDPSGTAIGLAVDEDQLSNSERSHTTEQIAFLVLEQAAVDGNRAPLATTPASFGAFEEATVSLQIEAYDPDGDTLSYWAYGLPFGLSIDPGTGLIEGTIGIGESGIFEVVVEVDDGTSVTYVSFDLAVATETVGARAQNGVVEQVSSAAWTQVVLPEIYASMVVVTTPSYTKQDAPAVVQVRNAFGDSFEVRMARRDGGADPLFADVHYLVVEEGVYNAVDHGVTLEAVKYHSTVTDNNASWVGETRTYANTYTDPVVLGQVMSANDDAPSSFWTYGGSVTEPPSAMDLSTGKTVAEDPNGHRADETIGYVVLEAGPGSLDGLFFEAGTGTDTIVGMGDQATPVSYQLSGVGSASVAIATVAGMDGGNGGWAVLHGPLDPGGASLALGVDEDTLRDSERNHTTEQVGYIVFK